MPPTLSIISISYKDPKGLQRTVDSLSDLVTTDGLSWEYIVVDGSPKINQPVLNNVPSAWPLKHIEAKPEGIYAAMNTGLRHSSGDSVLFLHGGDQLYSAGTLIELLNHFKGNVPPDMVVAGVELWRNNCRMYSKPPHPEFIQNLIGINNLCQQAIIYRRKTLIELGEFSLELSIAADYLHHFNYYIKEKKVTTVKCVLVKYDANGLSSNISELLRQFRLAQKMVAPDLSPTLKIKNYVGFYLQSAKMHSKKLIRHLPFIDRLTLYWWAVKERHR